MTSTAACPNCDQPLAAGASFCTWCGAAVPTSAAACSNCGAAAAAEAGFCQTCGSSLAAAPGRRPRSAAGRILPLLLVLIVGVVASGAWLLVSGGLPRFLAGSAGPSAAGSEPTQAEAAATPTPGGTSSALAGARPTLLPPAPTATETAVPTDTPTATPTSPPTATATETPRPILTPPQPPVASPGAGLGPADAVRQHYAFISARNYPAAWNMLSPRLRSNWDYNGWVAGFRTTRSVQTPSVTTTSQSGGAATVAVTVVSVDADGAGTVSKTFQGTWSLVFVDGGWKLDTASLKQTG